MKNRKLILIVSLVLALTMSLGGTLAYLTDTDADVNTMVLGNVKIAQNEQMRDENGELVEYQDKPALPAVYTSEAWADEKVTISGEEFKFFAPEMKNVNDKIVTVTNMGNTKAFVRTIIAIEAPEGFNDDLVHVNVNDTKGITASGWSYATTEAGVRYVYNIFTYTDALAAKATSLPSLMQVFLDKDTTNEDVAKLGEEWEIIALSQAVQAEGFSSAEVALNEAFDMEELATWLANAKENVGTPGDKWPNNNPPSEETPVVTNDAELKEAIEAGETEIVMQAGTYHMPAAAKGKTLKLMGTKDTIIEVVPGGQGEAGGQLDYSLDGSTVTFEGLTIKTNSQLYAGFARLSGTYNNCTIQNTYNLAASSVNVFNNCEINITNEYLRINGASSTVFNGCTFNTDGRAILFFQDGTNLAQTLTVKDCTFNATAPAYTWDDKLVAAVSIDSTKGISYTANFEGNNVVDDDFGGLVQIKKEVAPITINGATPTPITVKQ